MPKVTVYTRDIDADIWEWARTKAERDRTSLARVIADALYALRGPVKPDKPRTDQN
jgi:hypothetical protein